MDLATFSRISSERGYGSTLLFYKNILQQYENDISLEQILTMYNHTESRSKEREQCHKIFLNRKKTFQELHDAWENICKTRIHELIFKYPSKDVVIQELCIYAKEFQQWKYIADEISDESIYYFEVIDGMYRTAQSFEEYKETLSYINPKDTMRESVLKKMFLKSRNQDHWNETCLLSKTG